MSQTACVQLIQFLDRVQVVDTCVDRTSPPWTMSALIVLITISALMGVVRVAWYRLGRSRS